MRTRPAAYIRLAADSCPGTLAGQQRAIHEAARKRGWSEPELYLDIDGVEHPNDLESALTMLARAICAGQHNALFIGGVGTIRSSRAALVPLLLRCARNGVPVECVTWPAVSAIVPGQRLPS